MKNVIVILIVIMGLLIWVASGKIGRELAHSSVDLAKSKISERKEVKDITYGLINAAKELNKDTPKMLSDQLRLDRVYADTTQASITYSHTFVNISSKATDFDFLNNNLPKTIKFLCNDDDMNWLMLKGGLYKYIFKDKDGIEVGEFSISYSDCLEHKGV